VFGSRTDNSCGSSQKESMSWHTVGGPVEMPDHTLCPLHRLSLPVDYRENIRVCRKDPICLGPMDRLPRPGGQIRARDSASVEPSASGRTSVRAASYLPPLDQSHRVRVGCAPRFGGGREGKGSAGSYVHGADIPDDKAVAAEGVKDRVGGHRCMSRIISQSGRGKPPERSACHAPLFSYIFKQVNARACPTAVNPRHQVDLHHQQACRIHSQ
jgi:hypothetical protein